MMLPVEMLAAQGWPVLREASASSSKRLPVPMQFRHILHRQEGLSLTDSEMQRLAGNGMHLCQVGLPLLYVLTASKSA